MALKRDEVVSELILAGAVSEEQVSEAEDILRANLEAGQQALAGSEWILDQAARSLTVRSYPEAQDQFRIELPGPGINFDNLEASGTHLTLFNPETCKKAEHINWTPGREIHLIRSEQGLFVSGEFLNQSNLPITDRFLTYAKPRSSADAGPLDVFTGRSQQWLAIVDRGAGVVYLIDLQAGSLYQQFSVRAPGSSRAINLAIDDQNRQFYVADGTSSLGVWNFDGEQVRKLSPGVGLIGNVLLTLDGQSLYVMATKPNPGLKVLATDGSLKKEIAIKGDLYSVDSDAPTDLMALTPDGANLLFMTYLNDPEPFTPVITVVDTERQKTTQRFSIKDGTRPSLLSFMGMNPLATKNQTLVDLLLSLEQINADQLHTARIAVREKAAIIQAQEAAAAPVMDLDQRAFEEAQREKEEAAEAEAPSEDGKAQEVFKPEKAPQMNISPVADELIVDHCWRVIYNESRGEVDVKAEAYAEQLQRLQAAATRARNELEWHNGAIIRLKDFLNGKAFEVVIMRDQMEIMLHKHERDSLVKSGMPTVPSNCPNCSKPLFGSYICSYCGYEIERPEELLKRGLISIASITPLENLVEGHFLLIDIEGKRLLEIDTNRSIVWSMGKDILSEGSLDLHFPRDVVRMSNRNTLITDYSQNRVVEVTPSGRVFWEYNARKSSEHALSNPVRATANGLQHVLIVDQGRHRVLEVDKESEFLMVYGQLDNPGIGDGQLNMPSDIQRLVNGNLLITDTGNHRVIELEDSRLVWQYGNPENQESGGYGSAPGLLSYPQSALRLNNGNTLIVDAGNLRLIEITPEGEVAWEYRTNEGAEEHQMDSPFRAAKTADGLVMVLSETAVMEIDPKENKVVWACQLSEFERAKMVLKAEAQTKRFMKHGVRNPYTRTKTEDGPSEEAQSRLQELIAKRLATTRSPVHANKAHVTTFSKETLEPLDFFLVDRSRNRLMRIDREGQIAWRYGEKEAETLNKPHGCVKTPEGRALLTDTDGHRIIEIDPSNNQISWSFGKAGTPLNGAEGVNRPRSALVLKSGNILVTDQNNRRVFEVSKHGVVVWQYDGVVGPYYAERLANGNTLIVDWSSHYICEVNKAKEIVWSFGERKTSGNDATHLSYPEHATRLANGHTLITDTRNDRVIEVNAEGLIVWELKGSGDVKFGSPTYSARLKDGHTLVIHSSNRQMLEVDAEHKLYWKFMLPFERPVVKAPAGN